MADGKEAMESYRLDVKGMQVYVKIYSAEEAFAPIYEVTYPGIGDATKLLLMSLRPELMALIPLDPNRLNEGEYLEEMKDKYKQTSSMLIDRYLPQTPEEVKTLLIAYIMNMMIGLGDLEVPLADDNLEEVAVNTSTEYMWVFHKKYSWCKTNIKVPNEDYIYNKADQIGRGVGREINNLAPLMDAELADGSRVNATLYPISQKGNTITIRKFAKNPWTMPALIKNNTIDPYMAGLIWTCIENEISLLISGGTASGKTSFLNAMSIFFPPTRRIISVEETRELTLPEFFQWIPMLSRMPNPEGKGEVTLYQLMINALRQRPDIVVVGEVRVERDAETMFEAIHTGHAVYGTVHADNASDTIVRMTNPPIAVPKIMLNALGAVLVQFRHRAKGIRRTIEFAEVLKGGDVNVNYRWNMRTDAFSQVSELTRLADTINLYGGLSKSEIADGVDKKVKILKWMVKNGVLDVNSSGAVVSAYYKNKEKIIGFAEDDVKYSGEMLR